MNNNILAVALSTLALGAASTVSATTINFNNGSGTYSAGGVTVSVASTGTGAGLFYNSTENAIGVGSNVFNGGIGCKDSGCGIGSSGYVSTEQLTFTFSQAVKLNSVSFRQWENNVLGFGDEAILTYYVGTSNTVAGTLQFTDSGLGDGPLLDPFYLDDLELSKFTITGIAGSKTVNGAHVTARSAFYVHDLDYSLVETPTVPVPATAWLLGSGLAGLAGLTRRRREG